MATSTATQRVVDAARALGFEIEVREFPEGTRTADDAARAIGVEVGQIVKSLVFVAGREPVLCLVSGSNRLDEKRLADLTEGKTISRADANAVRDATGFAVGGVPPFGHPHQLAVFCDRDLLAYDEVWAAGGTPMSVFAISPQKLVEVCGATIADVKETA